MVVLTTMVASALFTEILQSDSDGIFIPASIAAVVAVCAAAAIPAWRSTAQLAIGWSCATLAWIAAIQISTSGGDPQMPWIGSIIVLGLAYVIVLQPLAEFQRQQIQSSNEHSTSERSETPELLRRVGYESD